MLRAIANYFRSMKCNHDFEELAEVTVNDSFLGTSTHKTFRCTKCGYVQRVRL